MDDDKLKFIIVWVYLDAFIAKVLTKKIYELTHFKYGFQLFIFIIEKFAISSKDFLIA